MRILRNAGRNVFETASTYHVPITLGDIQEHEMMLLLVQLGLLLGPLALAALCYFVTTESDKREGVDIDRWLSERGNFASR